MRAAGLPAARNRCGILGHGGDAASFQVKALARALTRRTEKGKHYGALTAKFVDIQAGRTGDDRRSAVRLAEGRPCGTGRSGLRLLLSGGVMLILPAVHRCIFHVLYLLIQKLGLCWHQRAVAACDRCANPMS
jgi:hypothetical protein